MTNIVESTSNLLEPVIPVRPVAGYIGGKRNLSRTLVAMIDATPHTLYAEPFVGMGGVFFRRTRRPRAEYINDISADVTTLFRILQRHYKAFLELLQWTIVSRAEFERLMTVDPSTCTDLERAARFLYLQRTAFGGKVAGRSFGVSYDQPNKFRLSEVEPLLQAAHQRLEPVYIERMPYADFIARYDRPGSLFYLDPPYHGNEADYGAGVFSVEDFDRLRGLLEQLKGCFILSINDTPAVREVFGRFVLEPVELNYRIAGRPTRARELIVRGGS